MEQLVARWAHNPKVASSSLAPATKVKAAIWPLFLMYWVYVLYSQEHNKIYVGYTSDLENRMRSHNQLAMKGWTVKFRPWSLVHSESVASKTVALKREKELKTARGRKFIWEVVLKKA